VEIEDTVVVDSTNKKMMSGNFSLFEKRNGKYICIRDMEVPICPIQKK
jgi:hypothetical protein